MAVIRKSRPQRMMLAILFSFFFAVLWGCGDKTAQSPVGAKARDQRAAKVVVVASVEKQPIERTITVLGSLKPQQEVVLAAKVAGRVDAISVDIGTKVKAGQIIATIDPADYELRLQQAEAALAQTRARLGLPLKGAGEKINLEAVSSVKEAKAVFEEARLNRDRARSLHQEQLIAKSEFDAAEAAYEVAMNRYESARDEARLRQAALAERTAELEFAKKQLADASILAPFDGVVQRRQANHGAYLKEGDAVAILVQTDPLRLYMEVPEPEAARVVRGQEVRFMLTGETKERKAAITRVSPALERVSRMLVVEADAANGDGSLPAGAFAQAQIVIQGESEAITVAPEAIRTFAGLQKVYIFENGKAVEKEITTGARSKNWVEVLSGIKPGDRVVLAPDGIRAGDALAVASSQSPAS